MSKVLDYFKSIINKEIIEKDITVYGYKFDYDYHLIGSIVPYLFEDLKITENVASLNNENRPGIVKEKKLITIHDTGDADEYKDALYWSTAVYNELNGDSKYAASFQYVLDNKAIYHNIPDNEVAWHAGDSTKFDYTLYNTNIKYTEEFDIDINSDGYYTINGEKTNILAPTDNGRILSKKDFNDAGILCVNKNGNFHLGLTYYNEVYKKIANRGGNNNSIGMEVCINIGQDIYLNWQRSAKLTAHLLDVNKLTFKDIVPHHFFSGKNCPQTLRRNDLWHHFLELVKVEYQVLQYMKEGYSIRFIPKTSNLLENGRVKSTSSPLSFAIEIKYLDNIETYEYES